MMAVTLACDACGSTPVGEDDTLCANCRAVSTFVDKRDDLLDALFGPANDDPIFSSTSDTIPAPRWTPVHGTFPLRHGCGAVYDASQWSARPFGWLQPDGAGGILEARQCLCGSHISIEVDA